MTSPWPDTAGGTEAGGDPAAEDSSYEDLPAQPLPDEGRRALVSLLMNRYISRDRHRAAWEAILAYESDLRGRLSEMYLDLVVDLDAEVAFKRQQDGDDIPRVLRREKALTRDASFVLVFLRREYAFADTGDGPVVITREQVSEFLRAYREDGDADDARFSRRVDAAITTLVRPWQVLEPYPAADYLFTISPVIVPLVGADEMRRFEEAFRKAAAGSEPRPGHARDDAEEADAEAADAAPEEKGEPS